MLNDPFLLRKLVRTFDFLESLGDSFHRDLCAQCVPVHINSGSFICMEGDETQVLPLVLEGTARVFYIGDRGREITLYRIEKGESCILTASCIMSHHVFPAHAVAEGDIEAIGVPQASVRDWTSRYDPWRTFLFELLSRRLATVISTLDEIAFKRVDERIARFLLDGSSAENGRIESTHVAIASDIGSSREVVSRILKDFEKRGFVDLGFKRIEVLDRPSLAGMLSA